MRVSSYTIPTIFILLALLLSTGNVYAQRSKVKCPNKKAFWKSSRTPKKIVTIPKVTIPSFSMPEIKVPKVKLPEFKAPKISMPEIKEPNVAILKSRRTASTKCPH